MKASWKAISMHVIKEKIWNKWVCAKCNIGKPCVKMLPLDDEPSFECEKHIDFSTADFTIKEDK